MKYLIEGLKENDLEDLVRSELSIDEYESKLDDDSIVVSFAVEDKDPAGDLNRFIQKGAVEILDTDVSPAPNQDGDYLVFVEMLRDDKFPERLVQMLHSLEGLTAVSKWTARVYDQEEIIPVTVEQVRSHCRLYAIDDADTVDESLAEFFRNSDLENMVVEGNRITLEGQKSTMAFDLVDHGSFDVVKERNAVLTQGLRLDEAAQHNVSRISALLGDHWVVEHLQNHVLLSSPLSEDVVLLRL